MGREVYIKAIAQVIPIYTMSCLNFQCIFKDIQIHLNRFWWGQWEGQREIHWLSWNRLCPSKFRGDMGFQKFEAFNLAFLTKQGSHLVQN